MKRVSILLHGIGYGLLAGLCVLATDLAYSRVLVSAPVSLDGRIATFYALAFSMIGLAAGLTGAALPRLGVGFPAAVVGVVVTYLVLALRLHDLVDTGMNGIIDGGLALLTLGVAAVVVRLASRTSDSAPRRATPGTLLAAYLPVLLVAAKLLVDTAPLRPPHPVPTALALAAAWPVIVTLGYGPLLAGRLRPAVLTAAAWIVPLGVIAVCALANRVGAGGWIVPSAHAAIPTDQPPIVWITVDTLRGDHVSVNGYPRHTTPELEALARTATVYPHCYAQGNSTWQSTPSLLSGLTPYRHGGVSESRRLPDDLWLLPEQLQARGYETLGLSANPWVSPRYGMTQGFEEFRLYNTDDQLTLYDVVKVATRLAPWQLHRLRDHLPPYATVPIATLIDDASRMLHQRDAHRPLFLYLQPIDPHGPYAPPRRYTPPSVQAISATDFVPYWSLKDGVTVNARQLHALMDLYDGEIAYTDAEIGRLFDVLRELGLFDRSLIIVTADHGEQFQEHGHWRHSNSLYQPLLHVPLIVKYPDQHAGRVVTDPVATVDIVPTILRELGEPCRNCDGRPLQDVDGGGSRPLLAYLMDREDIRPVMRSVIVGSWKLIRSEAAAGPAEELYDLDADPGETLDQRARYPDVAARLRAHLDAYEAAAGPLRTAEPITLPAGERSRLRALGYVQ